MDVLHALPREPGVHLAHPIGFKTFEYQRHKDDYRDSADLADLLRMGRLPEAVDHLSAVAATADLIFIRDVHDLTPGTGVSCGRVVYG